MRKFVVPLCFFLAVIALTGCNPKSVQSAGAPQASSIQAQTAAPSPPVSAAPVAPAPSASAIPAIPAVPASSAAPAPTKVSARAAGPIATIGTAVTVTADGETHILK